MAAAIGLREDYDAGAPRAIAKRANGLAPLQRTLRIVQGADLLLIPHGALRRAMRRVETGIGTKLRFVRRAPRTLVRGVVGERVRVEDKAAVDEARDGRAGVAICENVVGAS
jgi:hypothetical protein